jgi:hypothetical protein
LPVDQLDFGLSDHFLVRWPMLSAPQTMRGAIQASRFGRWGELPEETNVDELVDVCDADLCAVVDRLALNGGDFAALMLPDHAGVRHRR